MDNVAVGKMAAQEFLRQGFQNFAYLGMPERTFSNLRCQGLSGHADGGQTNL
jgi:DNA-binding LacI/PurR family transcriptional regulator